METVQLSDTYAGSSQLVVQAQWGGAGLRVRFADGCICLAPAADVLQGVKGLPTRVKIADEGPLGVTLWFGRRKEFYPWDWLRGYGDAAYRQRMAEATEKGRALVAAKVREARHAASLTQQEVADAAGVSRSTIARLEGGEGGVTFDTLERIAAAMGTGLLDVLGP